MSKKTIGHTLAIGEGQYEQLTKIKNATGATFTFIVTCALDEWIERHCGPNTEAGKELAAPVTPPPEIQP